MGVLIVVGGMVLLAFVGHALLTNMSKARKGYERPNPAAGANG